MATSDSMTMEEVGLNNEVSSDESTKQKTISRSRFGRVCDTLAYVPPRCRYDPDKPFEFSMGLNILFGRRATLPVTRKRC